MSETASNDESAAANREAGGGEEGNLLNLLEIVAENLRLLVLGPLAVGIVALGISFLITPTFTATVVFLPPQQQQSTAAALLQSLGSIAGLVGAAAGLKNPADQYVAFVKSRSVRDALIDRFKLMERYDVKLREQARRQLDSNTSVSSRRDGLIVLEFEDHDPKVAADIANAHLEELTRLMGRLALTEAQERRMFFEQQVKKAKDGLITAETALKATGVNESSIKASPGAAVTAVAAVMAQIATKEVQIGVMRGSLAEASPDLKQALTELTALRAQLTHLESDAAPAAGGGDYIAKYREFKYYETLFELMAKQYEIARIDESREGAVVQVVDKAVPPERKSKPKKALIAVFVTILAGLAMLLFVFVRQVLRDAYQNSESARKLENIRQGVRRAFRRSA